MGALALLFLAALPTAAWAHVPDAREAALPMWHWDVEPVLMLLIGLSLALYVVGVVRLWSHAGARRGITIAQCAAFAGGWLALAIALVSPLDTLGGRLFSAHMVQHELLMVVAAPLLVIGRPLAAWTWAMALSWRRAFGNLTRDPWIAVPWHTITQPVAAWALHAIALWVWHVPALFEAALHNEGVHVLQHTSFFATALLFWWAVLGGDARSRSSGFAIAYLFTTMMHTSALGALLSLAPTVWYPSYVETAQALGIDAVQDQQLGGLVMWVPGGVAYLLGGLALVARLLALRPAFPVSPASAVRPGLPR